MASRPTAALRRTVLAGGRGDVSNALARVDDLHIIDVLSRAALGPGGSREPWRVSYLKKRREQIVATT